MIKLIASDMDGTLLDKDGGISFFNQKMIKEAQKKGVHFVIASGRAYADIEPVMKKHDITCACVTGNGAQYIDESGKLVSACYLNDEDAYKTIDILNELEIKFMIYTLEGIYSIEPIEVVQDAFIIRGVKLHPETTYEQSKARLMAHHSIFKMSELKYEKGFLKDKQIIKIEAFSIDIDKIEEAKKRFKALHNISYLSSFPDNVEITHLEATKGKILQKAIQLFHIKEEEVMVIGDSYNDLSMFELFENSVAMGNSVDAIKEKAKYMSASYLEDGVGKAIERWVLK